MTKTIELKSPVQANGAEVTKLSMREPKVRDMLAAEKATNSSGELEILMFASICEVAPSVIEDLTMADYLRVQAAYQDFLS